MRILSRIVGNLLILASVGGLLLTLGSTSALRPATPELALLKRVPPTASTAGPGSSDRQSVVLNAAPVLAEEVRPPVQVPAGGSFTEAGPPAPTLVVAPAATPAAPPLTPSPTPVAPAPLVEVEPPSNPAHEAPTPAADPLADAELRPVANRAITRVVLPRIALAADVVPAQLVDQDDGVSWVVPAFKAGHAQYTAGPGEPGNGLLFGHVTSRSLGNVFEQLYRARVGDLVEVFAEQERFNYRVVEVHAVPRTDVSVLAPTESPSVSLITCTGAWNAALHDYMERLVVRAELIVP